MTVGDLIKALSHFNANTYVYCCECGRVSDVRGVVDVYGVEARKNCVIEFSMYGATQPKGLG